jgi:hypothetical protein
LYFDDIYDKRYSKFTAAEIGDKAAEAKALAAA